MVALGDHAGQGVSGADEVDNLNTAWKEGGDAQATAQIAALVTRTGPSMRVALDTWRSASGKKAES